MGFRAFEFATVPLVLLSLGVLQSCQSDVLGAPLRGSGGGSAIGGAGGGASLPDGTTAQALLPARIRRLSNAEYESSVRAVVGNTAPVAGDFTPDSRQGGYTVNDAQRVDSVLVKQLASAAGKLAAQVRERLTTVAPCADPAAAGEACASTFIQSFAGHAYRRPLSTEESAKLLELYRAGATGGTYADGIELVATGVLQSAGFLYLTETGNAAPGAVVSLTPYEVASALSYLVTAGPPDSALMAAAASGQLQTAEQRSAAFWRLVSTDATAESRERVVRVVREWLGVDRLTDTAKDSVAYRDFAKVKPAMLTETASFVDRLLSAKSGTVGELLGATWTVSSDPDLIAMYGGTPANAGEVNLPARRGILNQGAFLSVYAHASETGPVLRGVAVQRRVTCVVVPSPASLKITVPPLPIDTTKTMRERMQDHVVNPSCAGCHAAIDSFGFPFELYDGMGRSQPLDHGKPVDSHTTVSQHQDFDGDYADSNALAVALSNSASVRECFARQVFRASAGRSDAAVAASEAAFVDYWRNVPAPAVDAAHPSPASAAQGSILEALRAFVTSPTFTLRRAQ